MRFSAPASSSGHCGTERMASVAVNPGATGVTADPFLSPPRRDVAGERADSGFRGGIRRARGLALERRRRGHVDDRPAAATEHFGDGVFHGGHVSAQVHRHHAVPHVEIDIDHIGVGADRAHVGTDIEQQLDAVESTLRRVDQVCNRRGVSQVEADVSRGAARRHDPRAVCAARVHGDVADDRPGSPPRRAERPSRRRSRWRHPPRRQPCPSGREVPCTTLSVPEFRY